jgi:hypothetical protein
MIRALAPSRRSAPGNSRWPLPHSAPGSSTRWAAALPSKSAGQIEQDRQQVDATAVVDTTFLDCTNDQLGPYTA